MFPQGDRVLGSVYDASLLYLRMFEKVYKKARETSVTSC